MNRPEITRHDDGTVDIVVTDVKGNRLQCRQDPFFRPRAVGRPPPTGEGEQACAAIAARP